MSRKEFRILIQQIEDKLEQFLFHLLQKKEQLSQQEIDQQCCELCGAIQLCLGRQNKLQWRYNAKPEQVKLNDGTLLLLQIGFKERRNIETGKIIDSWVINI